MRADLCISQKVYAIHACRHYSILYHLKFTSLIHFLHPPPTPKNPPPPASPPPPNPFLHVPAMARIFALKVGVLPDNVLRTLLEDRLVLKGTVLAFVTAFFADFLATESTEVGGLCVCQGFFGGGRMGTKPLEATLCSCLPPACSQSSPQPTHAGLDHVSAFMHPHFSHNYLPSPSPWPLPPPHPMQSLVELLRKSKLEGRMLELFPPHKRTWEDFNAHFEAAGLQNLVEYNKKKRYDERIVELRVRGRWWGGEGRFFVSLWGCMSDIMHPHIVGSMTSFHRFYACSQAPPPPHPPHP
jgi:hypothetical protein